MGSKPKNSNILKFLPNTGCLQPRLRKIFDFFFPRNEIFPSWSQISSQCVSGSWSHTKTTTGPEIYTHTLTHSPLPTHTHTHTLGSLRSRGVGRCGTPKESISYGSLELKIHPKVDLLRSKTMLKHFLNNSKTTSKKSFSGLFQSSFRVV